MNQCKSCILQKNKKIRSTDEGIELLREKDRERYHRLGYKDKNKSLKEMRKKIDKDFKDKFPEKYHAKITSQRVCTPENTERHHWSYNKEHWKDVIFLTKKDHSSVHRFIIYD